MFWILPARNVSGSPSLRLLSLAVAQADSKFHRSCGARFFCSPEPEAEKLDEPAAM